MNILKNKLYTLFNNFVIIFSFNPKKLSVEKVGSDDLGIITFTMMKTLFIWSLTI